MASALRNFGQAASNNIAETVSTPIDAIAWALRKAGVPVGDAPVMGSEWMAQKGLTRPTQEGVSKMAGDFVGLVSPLAFEKQVASKLAGALRNGLPKNTPVGNMFIGESANTWDAVSAAQAKALEKQGKTPQEIWKETGTFKGVDGKYRQEIPDNKASYDTTALSELKENPNFNYLKDTQPLGGVVEHGELYKAYPNLSDVPVHFMPKEKLGDAYGAYSTKHDRITLGDLPNFDHTNNSLHEIQHAIQQREGWQSGGNLNTVSKIDDETKSQIADVEKEIRKAIDLKTNGGWLWEDSPLDEIIKTSYEPEHVKNWATSVVKGGDESIKNFFDSTPWAQYQRLSGEAEARATQARMNMTPEQRRAVFPLDSYDIPVNQLIVK